MLDIVGNFEDEIYFKSRFCTDKMIVEKTRQC